MLRSAGSAAFPRRRGRSILRSTVQSFPPRQLRSFDSLIRAADDVARRQAAVTEIGAPDEPDRG
jgi:hypothetical protein